MLCTFYTNRWQSPVLSKKLTNSTKRYYVIMTKTQTLGASLSN